MNAKQLQDNLKAAVASGKYMICTFHIDDKDIVHLNRHGNLSTADMERAVSLLSEDVMKQGDFNFLKSIDIPPSPPAELRKPVPVPMISVVDKDKDKGN